MKTEETIKLKPRIEMRFCPYCGHKKKHIVETSIKSKKICKNVHCGANELDL